MIQLSWNITLGVLRLFDFGSRTVTSLTASEKREVVSLIEAQDLAFEDGADHTAIVEDSDGGLAATASLFGNVVRMVAVAREHREAGLSAIAISCLIEAARVAGISHLFLYTKPDMAVHFASLGFRDIAETDAVSLLEIGEPGISAYRKYLASNRRDPGDDKKYGAIVVNCNPFTRGHRYLIDCALEKCSFLYVIVVEADLSTFPFSDRLAMVRAGTEDLEASKRVKVLGSGEYAVSAATFPTYFLKERAPLLVAEQQARLDIDLFVRLYVSSLGVNMRFVGSEPFSPVTAVYNSTMCEVLPLCGVEVVEIERLKTRSGDAITASAVRSMLESGELSGIGDYLPDSTFNYLREKLSYGL
jgi:[citrate (pro-3S)-lyase] ligase